MCACGGGGVDACGVGGVGACDVGGVGGVEVLVLVLVVLAVFCTCV